MKKLVIFLLSLILSFSFTLNAVANSNSVPNRYYGSDRYQTAIAIANELLKGQPNAQFDTVFIASGLNWPDAVVGTALAKNNKAPILLVDSTPERSAATLSFIEKHLPKENSIFLLGGTGVIPQSFTDYFVRAGYSQDKIHQIGGIDRNETSLLIAKALNPSAPNQVFLVSDENYTDALSIATYSAKMNDPILLINSKGLTMEQKEYVDKAAAVFYIGDLATWIDKVYTRSVQNPPGPKQYVYGSTKYETNGSVVEQFNKFSSNLFLASGDDYPDALAGSVLASRYNGSIVFIPPQSLTSDAIDTLNNLAYLAHNPDRSLNSGPPYFSHTVWVLGGPGAISDEVVKAAEKILSGNGYKVDYK